MPLDSVVYVHVFQGRCFSWPPFVYSQQQGLSACSQHLFRVKSHSIYYAPDICIMYFHEQINMYHVQYQCCPYSMGWPPSSPAGKQPTLPLPNDPQRICCRLVQSIDSKTHYLCNPKKSMTGLCITIPKYPCVIILAFHVTFRTDTPSNKASLRR